MGARSRSRWVVTAFVLAVAAACGGSSNLHSNVARGQLARTGVAAFDGFFQALHAMQVAVNESERTKVDLVASLADAVGLPDSAEITACAAAVRTHVTRLHDANVPVTIRLEPDEDRSPVPRLVHDVGPMAASADRRAVDGTARAVQRALDLQRSMLALQASAVDLHSTGEALRRTAPQRVGSGAGSVDVEFRDALDFLEGVGPRAAAQAEAAQQIAVRLVASATVSTTPGSSGQGADGNTGADDAPKISAASGLDVRCRQEDLAHE